MALARTTTYWRPESSLTRESFNDIVNRRKTNVPAVLMKSGTMSRLAMLARPLFEPLPGTCNDCGFAQSRLAFDRFPDEGIEQEEMKRSVRFDREEGDGFGSIRLGTPTTEQRNSRRRPHLLTPTLSDDSGTDTLQRSSSMPVVRATPAARFGYMPPGYGRIQRSRSGSKVSEVSKDVHDELSSELLASVTELFDKWDDNRNGLVEIEEATHHFKRFAKVSAKAMFNEVDSDGDGFITRQEFIDFWRQVKKSGYNEEDLQVELQELLQGNVWVDYADSRDVGAG